VTIFPLFLSRNHTTQTHTYTQTHTRTHTRRHAHTHTNAWTFTLRRTFGHSVNKVMWKCQYVFFFLSRFLCQGRKEVVQRMWHLHQWLKCVCLCVCEREKRGPVKVDKWGLKVNAKEIFSLSYFQRDLQNLFLHLETSLDGISKRMLWKTM